MALIMAVYAGASAVMAALAVPLIRGQIPRNKFYGVRIRQTLENPDVWYPVNAFMGKRLFVVGLLSASAAIVLYVLPGMTLDTYALACLAVILIGFAVTTVQSVQYLRALGK